jgi:hypothetical protein
MQTAVSMQPSDFEAYTIRSEGPCDLTFPLKEFRVRRTASCVSRG